MSSNDFKKVAWSDQLEDHFAETAEKCQGYAWLHKKSEAVFSKKRSNIDLPVIVLSTVAGTLSIGSGSIFGEGNEQTAGMGIGLLSLLVGVLNTVSTYYGYAKRAENHRLCSIEYSKLFRFISIELSLPRTERMLCGDLLKVVQEQYERLQEISPLVPDHILNEFKQRFKDYEDVSKPNETNGLHGVSIYRDGRKRTLYELVREASSRDLGATPPQTTLGATAPRIDDVRNLRITAPTPPEDTPPENQGTP